MMEPLTESQRAANKTARLKHASSPDDGLTVRTKDGADVVMSKARALAKIAAGEVESAE